MTQQSDGDAARDGDASPGRYKAVTHVAPPPDGHGCGRFERGHHGHPVQVALAMKQAGDDRLFRPVRLEAVTASRAADQPVAALALIADDDQSRIEIVGHEPAVVPRLLSIEDPFFVWEPKYGVLFFMTEQSREVMGTGSMTCCSAAEFVPCQ